MEERSGKPVKQIEVHSRSVGGHNLYVKHKPDDRPPKEDKRTLVDYVPPVIDDPQIDKVIDDIIVSESNEVLAAEDSMYISSLDDKPKKKKHSIYKLLKNKWLYISLGVIIIGLFVLPYSRYLIFGQFISYDYQFSITDSVTHSPVSGALITLGKDSVTTNSSGLAKLKLPVGKHKFNISKHYYAQATGNIFVGFAGTRADNIHLAATGRQVPVTVFNKLTGKTLAGVQISVLNTTAITNSKGQVNIVLPTKKLTYETTVSANGYNELVIPIEVTAAKNVNVISLVPSGFVYYLSNTTGTINVIKADLDGSNPTIELAGTGSETATTTKLITSPDGKYLLLEAQRSGSQPELYVINASNGNLTEFDSSPDNFTLIGWSNDQFIYDEVVSSESTSTVAREQLKSYNAETNQLNVLDEDQVAGNSSSYAYQSFANFELLPSEIVYTTIWNSVSGYSLASQNDTIRSVEPNGLNKKDYSTFPSQTTGTMSIVRNEPTSLYISVVNSSTSQTSYYEFTDSGLTDATITSATFTASYPTYYISPSEEDSLWTTNQNNQLTTYIGNLNGQNSKKVTLPAGYTAAGWLDNIYILLTDNGQLYIAPATGSNSPVLIDNYLNN